MGSRRRKESRKRAKKGGKERVKEYTRVGGWGRMIGVEGKGRRRGRQERREEVGKPNLL